MIVDIRVDGESSSRASNVNVLATVVVVVESAHRALLDGDDWGRHGR